MLITNKAPGEWNVIIVRSDQNFLCSFLLNSSPDYIKMRCTHSEFSAALTYSYNYKWHLQNESVITQ